MRQGTFGLRDDFLRLATNGLGLGFGGDDFFVLKQRGDQIATQRLAVAAAAAQSFATHTMSHEETSFTNSLFAAATRIVGVFGQQVFLLKALNQFTQRFLAEVTNGEHGIRAAIQHFEDFAHVGDAGALQRIEDAHAQVELLNRNVVGAAVWAIGFDFFFRLAHMLIDVFRRRCCRRSSDG